MSKDERYLLIAHIATVQASEYGYKTGFETKLADEEVQRQLIEIYNKEK